MWILSKVLSDEPGIIQCDVCEDECEEVWIATNRARLEHNPDDGFYSTMVFYGHKECLQGVMNNER